MPPAEPPAPTPPAPARSARAWAPALAALLLVAVVFWAFAPALGFGFVNYDDNHYVTANPQVQSGLTLAGLRWALTTFHTGYWHPLTWLSLMLDQQLIASLAPADRPAFLFHLTNILLHCLNALLLYALLGSMTGAWWRSLIVAILFALHPLRVESVAWVSERKDVLSVALGLITALAYVHYARRPGWLRHLLVVVLFFLSLAAKPMLMTLPALLLLLDYWPLRRGAAPAWLVPAATPGLDQGHAFSRRPLLGLLLEKAPLFLLALGCAGLTVYAQKLYGVIDEVPATQTALARAGNVVVAYGRYLLKQVDFSSLAVFYPLPDGWPWSWVAASAGALLLVSAAALVLARRAPWVVVGWLWFMGLLLPVVGFLPLAEQSIADRYTYLAGVGLLVMLVWSVPAAWLASLASRLAVGAGVILLSLHLAASARAQSAVWRDSETLFAHAIRVSPNNWLAYNNLGAHYARSGRAADAIAQFESALAIKPGYHRARHNLGAAYELLPDLPAAAQAYRRVVADQPGNLLSREALGGVLARMGDLAGAAGEYRAVLEALPRRAQVRGQLGAVLARQGDLAGALEQFRLALRDTPNDAEAHFNLGLALEAKGESRAAADAYAQAVALRPEFARAHHNLAVALAATGGVAQAETHYRRALSIDGRYLLAMLNLAALLESTGRGAQAVPWLQRALEIDPANASAAAALARLRAAPGPSSAPSAVPAPTPPMPPPPAPHNPGSP